MITGTAPVLAALTDGDTLSSAVTLGSYSGTGTVTTTQQMRVDAGSWVAYVGATVVELGEVWQVRELCSDDLVTDQAFTSGTQSVTEALPPSNTIAPAITGDLIVGETLSLSTGTWTPTPDEYQREWLADASVVGTGSTLDLTGREGEVISARVRARVTNDLWSDWEDATGSGEVEASAAPSTPVIVTPGSIDAQPIVGQSVLLSEPDVTGADSVAYQWFSDPGVWAAPISGATSAAFTPTATEYALTGPIGRRATYTNGVGSTIENLTAPTRVGAVYSDDWAGYALADGLTQLDTLYDRFTGSGLTAAVITDAAAPAGKSLRMTVAAANQRGIWLTAAQVFGTARAADTAETEALFIFRHLGNGEGRYHLRFLAESLTAPGPGLMVYNHVARLQSDVDNPANNVGELMDAALIPGTIYCCRVTQSGTNASGKLWEFDTPEPADADAIDRPCSGVIKPPAALIGVRSALTPPQDQYELLWWAAGYNAPAPYWPGYVAPPKGVTDNLDFIAAASGTEIDFAGGAGAGGITLTFEDAT